MRVSVIDVGSNTARLLVADVEGKSVQAVAEERAYLGLGEVLAGGDLSEEKLDEAAEAARRFATRASEFTIERAETIVTAPGRHGRASERLLEVLRDATGSVVRVLSADEEGRLAFEGAVARASSLPEVVAVVDVGGGSSELVIGTPLLGPAWVRSLPAGSLRLSSAWLQDDPPTAAQIAAAREAVRRLLAEVDPPRPDSALATGGSARALIRVVGRRYGPDELDEAVAVLSSRRIGAIVRSFGIHPRRAGTLVAGAIVLAEVSRLLDRPYEVARGGLREGAALALAGRAATVAAA